MKTLDLLTRSLNNRLVLFICLQFYSFMAVGQNRFEDIFNIDNSSIGVYNFSAKIDSNLIITDTISIHEKTYPIQYIRSMGFIGIEELKTIQLPHNLLGIGNNAFEDCINLESIFIPEKVRFIKKDAFLNTGLRYASVADGNTQYDSRNNCNAIIETATCKLVLGTANTVIPNSVTCIGENAFLGRKQLKSISIPGNVEVLEKNAFKCCDSLQNVNIEPALLGLKMIGDGTFSYCKKLENITLPSSLECISRWAFCKTSLRSIYIPENVIKIGESVLGGCSKLESIVVNPNNQHYDSRNNCNAIIETATCKLISGCNNTVIPPGVKIIGKLAFEGMSNLVNIVIPEGVTDMEELCFASCDNLEAIELPTTIKTVDDCFGGCDKLKSVTIYSRKPPLLYHHEYREYMDIKLYVPKGCRKKYIKTAWRDFGNIIEMENKGR